MTELPSIGACLDQHFIVIRSSGIRGNHLRSGTSLITIIYIAQLRSQKLVTELAFVNCDWLHTVLRATWWGGWELSLAASAASCVLCGEMIKGCLKAGHSSGCEVTCIILPDWLQW